MIRSIPRIIYGASPFTAMIRREVTSFQPTSTWRLSGHCLRTAHDDCCYSRHRPFVGVKHKIPSDRRMKFCSARKPPTFSDDGMGSGETSERLAATDPNADEDQNLKTEIESMKRDYTELKMKMGLMEDEMKNLKGRLYTVFYPSVLHSLLETAVKECLKKEGVTVEQQGRFYHSCCKFAHGTLRKMLGDTGKFPKRNLDGFAKNLTSEVAIQWTKTIHRGITFFVEVLDKTQFDGWPPDRNPLMHNGAFIDALYGLGTSDGTMIDEDAIKEIREAISNKVENLDISNIGCENSYTEIQKAIERKRLEFHEHEKKNFYVKGAEGVNP